MSEINRSELSLTEQQKTVLNFITNSIMTRDRLVIKYSLGLHIVTAERSQIFDPLEDDPDLKLRATILASGIRETYFGIRVDQPLDGDTSVPTYYSITQVNKETGISVEGLDVCVGHILGNRMTIEPNVAAHFTTTDLWTIKALGDHQLEAGFNPRLIYS